MRATGRAGLRKKLTHRAVTIHAPASSTASSSFPLPLQCCCPFKFEDQGQSLDVSFWEKTSPKTWASFGWGGTSWARTWLSHEFEESSGTQHRGHGLKRRFTQESSGRAGQGTLSISPCSAPELDTDCARESVFPAGTHHCKPREETKPISMGLGLGIQGSPLVRRSHLWALVLIVFLQETPRGLLKRSIFHPEG